MTVDVDVSLGPLSVPAVQVPSTAVDVTPFNGSGTLYGWSLREASGDVASTVNGSVVAPAAGATIATSGALAAGTYTIGTEVELQGAAAAGDANNFQLFNGATLVGTSQNLGAAGVYPQQAVEVTVPQGAVITVKALGAGTAGVTYSVEMSIIPDKAVGFTAEIQGGNQPLGESSAGVLGTDTRWFGPNGIPVEQKVMVHVLNGTVTGCLYIQPDY